MKFEVGTWLWTTDVTRGLGIDARPVHSPG